MTALDRRVLLQLLGLAALGVPLAGCGAADANLVLSSVARKPAGTPSTSTLAPFGAAVLDRTDPGNAVISPLSIAIVLAMLANGADGTTRTEFESVLGSGVTSLNAELNTVSQRLTALDGVKGTTLTLSDALWLQKGGAWQQPFLDALKQWYGAGARVADFAADPVAAIEAINAWCDTSTKGLIPTIVDDTMITRDTRLVAGNAVYVKGAWKLEFDPARTTRESFRTGVGGQVSVDMMHDSRSVRFLETAAFTAIELPFRHEDLAFVVALPASGGALTASAMSRMTDVLDAPAQEVDIALPRFHAACTRSLRQTLVALGLVEAWTDGADFSGISHQESLVLGFVQHKAVVTVDETGAEAAAVTVGGVTMSAMRETVRFTVDRPFLWAIVHVPTRTLVMLGREDDPTIS